jgi:hypothetical protein
MESSLRPHIDFSKMQQLILPVHFTSAAGPDLPCPLGLSWRLPMDGSCVCTWLLEHELWLQVYALSWFGVGQKYYKFTPPWNDSQQVTVFSAGQFWSASHMVPLRYLVELNSSCPCCTTHTNSSFCLCHPPASAPQTNNCSQILFSESAVRGPNLRPMLLFPYIHLVTWSKPFLSGVLGLEYGTQWT